MTKHIISVDDFRNKVIKEVEFAYDHYRAIGKSLIGIWHMDDVGADFLYQVKQNNKVLSEHILFEDAIKAYNEI